MREHGKRPGFTLVELLVVISIIALLMSILMPALSAARERAKRLVCMSNMRQLLMATMTYGAENNNHIPGWWDGRESLGNSLLLATTQAAPEHLQYGVGIKRSLGRLYPSYLKDGHAFYCPSKTANNYHKGTKLAPGRYDYDFSHMDHLVQADHDYTVSSQCSALSSYHFRGSLAIPRKVSDWLAPYRYERILEKHPRWIILSDMGWYESNGVQIINHKDSKGLAAYFNNGWADGHASPYHVKYKDSEPLITNGHWTALGMDWMAINQY